MNNQRATLRGGLLLELMLVCALLAIILPLLIAPLWQLQQRHGVALTYLDQSKFQIALASQFEAHWSRLLPAACYLDTGLSLTIGTADEPPARLSQRSLVPQSDWLEAVDYGACRVSLGTVNSPLVSANHCDLSAGDWVRVASCHTSEQTQVAQANGQSFTLNLLDQDMLGQTAFLESQQAFYWYAGEGKNGQPAFWRTPQLSGNSLELWAGLMALAISPLLDENQDGLVDTIDARYGTYSLTKVRALWVEYLYQLSPCQAATQPPQTQVYNTLRGERWQYLAPCQGVAKQVIVLNGFG
ncbi:hypothetical protein [Marinomonas pollencensis]|uniref:Uncharacterized protein n=1 Tax=Marinomonas pollencensis TaxID=491954 RepID=A0A3E0DS93_9GAMM|nr:hypothetical protein [Marinomonas pollencensis]REG84288.1 hypothetical protein DFP81_104167 [Marinomonas pollencensis]